MTVTTRIRALALTCILALSLGACTGGGGGAGLTPDSFESFAISFGAGPCKPAADCSEFIELYADGSLRYDAFGEVPVVVHEATVSAEDLDAIIPTLIADDLVDLLTLDMAPCLPPTDIGESMTLVADGVTYDNSTTACEDAPLTRVRDELDALVASYFP